MTTAPPLLLAIESARLAAWLVALDEVIDELKDDLVRRSIVHLSTLREDVLRAISTDL